MTYNIYALLVAIDEYPSPVPSLNGCVNDILGIQEYLQGRVAVDGDKLHIRTLLNRDATRQAVVDGFRQHLCQASAEDVAFFYYAGHGSQEQAPQEFWAIEPERLDETLVCYDSRTEGGWDLADKELAKLISEVDEKNPHTVIILDCCHSGAGTRGGLEAETAVRKTSTDKRQRPLESFIFSLSETDKLSAALSPEKNPSAWSFPTGKHIVLAACRDSETAKEFNSNGQPRGAFSYFLLDTLKKANGSLTYRDLFKRVNALVRSKITAQSPQIEATELSDLDQPFLGGAIANRTPYFTVFYDKNHDWVIDGGAVHGISQPVGNDTTILALFPFDTPTEQLRELSTAVGEAKIVEVMPQLSKVQISGIGDLNPEMTWKAVITSLPLPPKGVLLSGEPAGVELARTTLLNTGHNQPSLYVREVATPEAAELKLLARDGNYLITRPADDRPLVAAISGYTDATALQAIKRLEHITRWLNITELASPATSRIRPDAVQMLIYQQDGQPLLDPQIRLEYQQENGRWRSPRFKIKLKNTSNEPLYCAVLDLTDRYAVSAELLDGGGIWLEPRGQEGDEAWVNRGNPICPTVPKQLWQKAGITEVKDILKLIICSTEFDATLLQQPELDLPPRLLPTPRCGNGTLNRLMQRIPARDLRSRPEEDEIYDDWLTSQISITTVRPLHSTPIPTGDESVFLGVGSTLYAHSEFRAKARLTTVTQSTRDLGNHMLPPILREDDPGIESFEFTSSRGTDPGLSALELTEVENPSAVTPKNPLKVIVDRPLASDEQLLPISYDGEFFLPLGRARSTPEGKTEILLERLTEPISEGSRSLGGSIRIFFQKVVSQKLGLEFNYPILAAADVTASGVVNYTRDVEQVKSRVAQAQRIVLYIHGIIGDTESLLPSLRSAQVEVDGTQKPLAELYDLVLSYDYENINTSIVENAKLLKQRLQAVGLGENHGKIFHIVADSMGGLVSRWFIEREGGNQVVGHLIMIGTPNAGCPWSTVEDWALATLSIGLNGLSEFPWPVSVMGILVQAINRFVDEIETIDISLDEMHPCSEFLEQLAASPDPKVPYSIIAGNTSIIPAALKAEANQTSSPLQRLMQKLFDKAVAMAFFEQPNDIAVTVQSIKSVGSDRTPQPQIQEIGCDHMVYFTEPVGLTALSQAVIQALENNSDLGATTTTKTTTVANPVVNDITNNSSGNKALKWWIIGVVGVLFAAILGWLVLKPSNNTEPSNQSQLSDNLGQSWVSGQRSAVSGQHSAVSGQRSAVSRQLKINLIWENLIGKHSAVSGQRSAVSRQPSAVSGQPSAKGSRCLRCFP
ncbi:MULTISPECIES: caspase family protein [Moorena]|uniref:Caspase domain protein n=1 Tax=Moorena producens 3L TaxID=489825 RepID=F4Y0H7_9CYAN|nr:MULTISPECIES: caspase family protein [Moorena]EGJ29601.1 caspase domain protein [Moorena producens 3L]NEP66175.1 caspase [Moorena sp. SIO3A5]OLT65479.1 caspase [Moorena producens 3L]